MILLSMILSKYSESIRQSQTTAEGKRRPVRFCGLLNQEGNFTFSSHGPCFYDDYTKKSKI